MTIKTYRQRPAIRTRPYEINFMDLTRDVRRGYEYFWSRRPHVHRPDTGSFLPDIRHRATPTAGFAP